MISAFDFFIIAVYLLFLVAIGVVFRRMSQDTSDYFRAGGSMPWYITGTSANTKTSTLTNCVPRS